MSPLPAPCAAATGCAHSAVTYRKYSEYQSWERHDRIRLWNPLSVFQPLPFVPKRDIQIELAKQDEPLRQWLVIPKAMGRRPIHDSVPAELLADFQEAVMTLQDSPKSSATLSQRCLQSLLILQGAKQRDLVDQLETIHPSLSSYVQSYVDNVRKLGNLAAHAKQSIAIRVIVGVEPVEAEWMRELLEELFDHYYAKPAEGQARQATLNARFADAQRLKNT